MTNEFPSPKTFGEPPPLPRTEERFSAAPVVAAVVVGAALVLAFLLFALNAAKKPVNEVDAVGSDQSVAGKGGSGGSGKGEASNGHDESGNGQQSTDGAEANGNTDAQGTADGGEVRAAITGKDAPEPISDGTEIGTTKVGTDASTEETKREVSPGNQFFTLGDRKDRVGTTNVLDKSPSDSPGVSDAFSGRGAGRKDRLLKAEGGTDVTEAAVKLGLEWLAKNQQASGLWSLNGPYEDGSPIENNAAATAMALLAFQGAGHTHRGAADDEFTRVVSKGANALLKHVYGKESADNELIEGNGYTQAMCTMAICELYGMTHDPKLRTPAIKSVEYCVNSQSSQGGWRYKPRQDSDTSVTGWFVMGLQSARMSGLKVSDKTLDGVTEYLNHAANKYGSRYSYQPGVPETPSMTAEGLLCRQYLGWKHDDPRLGDGTQYLLTQLPNWKSGDRDAYRWYYATQVCHHMGGDYWRRWNSAMQEVLPANQILNGQERGSWDPRGDRWGGQGGRLYVTCLSLYMLEVYYRYLPLYQDGAVIHRL